MERGHTACPRPSKWGPGEGQDADLRRAGDAAVPEPGLYTGRLSDCLASDRRRRAAALRWPIEANVVRACASPLRPEARLERSPRPPRGSASSRPRARAPSGCSRSRRKATARSGHGPTAASGGSGRRRSPASPASRPLTSMTPATSDLVAAVLGPQVGLPHRAVRELQAQCSSRPGRGSGARRPRTSDTPSRAGRGSCRSRGGAMSSRPRPRCRRSRSSTISGRPPGMIQNAGSSSWMRCAPAATAAFSSRVDRRHERPGQLALVGIRGRRVRCGTPG